MKSSLRLFSLICLIFLECPSPILPKKYLTRSQKNGRAIQFGNKDKIRKIQNSHKFLKYVRDR